MADPSREPVQVLLLPGMDGTGDLFEGFVERTPRRFTTRVVPFPRDRRLDYPELAELVRTRLPPSGRFVLLGESFSGPLALLVARDGPPGLAGVVLAASFVRAPVAARRLAWLGGLPGRRRMPSWVVARVLTGDDLPLAVSVRQATDRVEGTVLAHRMRSIARADAREDLAHCPVPVLALRATSDRLLGASQAEEMLEARPDVTVREIAAPHLLLQAAPDAAWAAIRAWLP